MMENPNLGWLYYRDLYNDQREENVFVEGKPKTAKFSFDFLKKEKERTPSKEQNAIIKKRSQFFFDKKLREYNPDVFLERKEFSNRFELTTTYPGLLCGVGYNHGINSEADYKVGFYFDHTTGLPVIPGSSVKGLLRSAFPGFIRKEENDKPSKEVMKERYDFFKWLVNEVNRKEKADIPPLSDKQIDQLESYIFEGRDNAEKQLSYYKRDRFFDSYPIESLEHEGCFLKNDYITPHINREKPEMSPFSNPNPIQFLKVLSKVKFRFQFNLVEGGGLKENQKELLFKEIICFMGVGAKTNVGYGQFEEGFRNELIGESLKSIDPQNYIGKRKLGFELEAKVVDHDKKKVEIIVEGKNYIVSMSGICPENDAIVNVKINEVNHKNEITSVGFMGKKRHI